MNFVIDQTKPNTRDHPVSVDTQPSYEHITPTLE